MKKFTILTIFLIFFFSAAQVQAEPLNITAAEVEDAEVLHAYPIGSHHLEVFSKCRGVPVVSIFLLTEQVIVRYCYLEKGKLVGFMILDKIYEATGEKKYVAEEVSAEMTPILTSMLLRVKAGLTPVEFE